MLLQLSNSDWINIGIAIFTAIAAIVAAFAAYIAWKTFNDNNKKDEPSLDITYHFKDIVEGKNDDFKLIVIVNVKNISNKLIRVMSIGAEEPLYIFKKEDYYHNINLPTNPLKHDDWFEFSIKCSNMFCGFQEEFIKLTEEERMNLIIRNEFSICLFDDHNKKYSSKVVSRLSIFQVYDYMYNLKLKEQKPLLSVYDVVKGAFSKRQKW